MKHHALLGLILGLFAATRSGAAEPPVLFNVYFNPVSKEVTITGTGEFTTLNPSAPQSLASYADGVTLINFFNAGFNEGFTSLVDTASLAVNIGTSSSALQFEITGLSIQNAQGITNNGKNLLLFTPSGTDILFNSGTVSFSAGTSLRFVTEDSPTVPTNTTNPLDLNYIGPLNVYAGYNSAHGGTSFLGTYTLTVVPEPSTYAAIAGGLGLAAAVIHRRRQRAKAAQA
jgi:hypothetical protein